MKNTIPKAQLMLCILVIALTCVANNDYAQLTDPQAAAEMQSEWSETQAVDNSSNDNNGTEQTFTQWNDGNTQTTENNTGIDVQPSEDVAHQEIYQDNNGDIHEFTQYRDGTVETSENGNSTVDNGDDNNDHFETGNDVDHESDHADSDNGESDHESDHTDSDNGENN